MPSWQSTCKSSTPGLVKCMSTSETFEISCCRQVDAFAACKAVGCRGSLGPCNDISSTFPEIGQCLLRVSWEPEWDMHLSLEGAGRTDYWHLAPNPMRKWNSTDQLVSTNKGLMKNVISFLLLDSVALFFLLFREDLLRVFQERVSDILCPELVAPVRLF